MVWLMDCHEMPWNSAWWRVLTLLNLVTDKNLIFIKPRWRTADDWTYPQSTYSKQLSRGQNWYGTDADGGAYWRHLMNMIEPFVCGGDASLCQITLITCIYVSFGQGSSLLWTHTLRPFYRRPIALTQVNDVCKCVRDWRVREGWVIMSSLSGIYCAPLLGVAYCLA